jgi:hypothetical protein
VPVSPPLLGAQVREALQPLKESSPQLMGKAAAAIRNPAPASP